MANKASKAEMPREERLSVLERYQLEIAQMKSGMASSKASEHVCADMTNYTNLSIS